MHAEKGPLIPGEAGLASFNQAAWIASMQPFPQPLFPNNLVRLKFTNWGTNDGAAGF